MLPVFSNIDQVLFLQRGIGILTHKQAIDSKKRLASDVKRSLN